MDRRRHDGRFHSSDRSARDHDRLNVNYRRDKPNTSISSRQIEQDRAWYDQEESSEAVDLSINASVPSISIRKTGNQSSNTRIGRQSLKRQQLERDGDKWEANRMRVAGAASGSNAFDADADEDHGQTQNHLIHHEALPLFLSGLADAANLSSSSYEPVLPVKDATSDMAVISRKGSQLVRSLRDKKEREKSMKALAGSGTSLGNILGVGSSEKDDQLDAINVKETDEEEFTESMHAKLSIKEQREMLPAFACRSQLIQLIRENQAVIVVGETGSGKTTQLAQYLFEEGFTRHNQMIGCTQPRRVAAMSVARRVSQEMNCQLGGVVGYAIRFEDCTSKDTRIKYMTDGVLLRETLCDTDIDAYSAIIIDEAHERSLQTDVLLGLLRRILARRRDLRVVVTSATMDAERFSSFFGNAPIYTIPGRTYPVEVMYSRNPCEDYVESAVKQAVSLHLTYPPGDILIFMTGQEDIDATCMSIADRLKILNDSRQEGVDPIQPLLLLPIYSQLPVDMQSRIFESAPRGQRKCIVATNIAETSLTVDGIRYVIDCGYSKVKVYSPRIGMDALQVYPISQAAANQRAGRAGRTGPGVCFRMYTETAYRTELFAANVPEIRRTNLANVVLLLKSLGISDLLSFDFIDSPPVGALITAMHQLWILCALDDQGTLTSLGKAMVQFPLDPPLSRLLLAAIELGCVEEAVVVVSMLSVPSIFYRPKERQSESDAARERFLVPESDHLTLLNVYRQWKAHGCSDRWCESNFLHAKALRRAQEVYGQLMDLVKQQLNGQRQISSAGMDLQVLRQCIAMAYVHKVAKARNLGEYYNIRNGLSCHLHPTSALYGLGYTPDYVVYHELLLTSKEFMMGVTAIDPVWLAMACPWLYSLRVSSFSADGSVHTETVNFKDQKSAVETGDASPLIERSVESATNRSVKKSKTSMQRSIDVDQDDEDEDSVVIIRPMRHGS